MNKNEPTFTDLEKKKFKKFTFIIVAVFILVLIGTSLNENLGPRLLGNSGGGGDVDDSTPNFVWEEDDYVEPDPPEDLPPEDVKIDQYDVPKDEDGNPIDNSDPDDLPEWDENDDDREPDGGLFPDGAVPEYDDTGVDPNANQTGEESGPTSSPEPGSGTDYSESDYTSPSSSDDYKTPGFVEWLWGNTLSSLGSIFSTDYGYDLTSDDTSNSNQDDGDWFEDFWDDTLDFFGTGFEYGWESDAEDFYDDEDGPTPSPEVPADDEIFNVEADEISINIEQLNKANIFAATNSPKDNIRALIDVDYTHNNGKKIIAEKPLVEYYYTVQVPLEGGDFELVEGRKSQIAAIPEGLSGDEVEIDGSGTVTWEINIPELDYNDMTIVYNGEAYTLKVNWWLEVSAKARDERGEITGFYNGDIDIVD
jgi:hypothetical protein